MSTPHKQVTLREVIAVFEKRLGEVPLKTYWRESTNEASGRVDTRGCEMVFMGLKSSTVLGAMKGVPLIESRKFKSGKRAYKWLLRWEVKSSSIKFRCTLYVFEDGLRHFIFTTEW